MSNDTLTHSVTFTEAPAALTVVVDPTPQIARGSAVIVERRRPKAAGWSLLQGLGVVVDHWRKSFRKLDDPTQIAGTFTTEYPEERLPLPEAYRNMPILLFDDATGHELCTSCFQCQRICPPQVIHMTQAKDPETGKPVPAVSEFIIEYDACMSCGFCAEVCPFDAIKMDHDFELSTANHPSLTVHKAGLLRPVSYYQSIAPTFWAEAEASAYKKLEANKKRRPASIGIAPQMIEQVKAAHELRDDQQEADSPPAPVAIAPALDAGRAATPATASAAPAASDGDLPTDKAARLAAIRARNEAKKAAEQAAPAQAQPAAEGAATALTTPDAPLTDALPAASERTAPPAPATPDAPLDEKAARLAAIRARNAAKKAAQAEEE
ncbi:MAG: 4Fe-4S dicluster domain-containing protein [Chloroflexaceae bacterium]|nr:4Fe-4S dicluster domain-containing protein [Chloroflexaceae bacterium]